MNRISIYQFYSERVLFVGVGRRRVRCCGLLVGSVDSSGRYRGV